MSHADDDEKALARAIILQVLEATMAAWRVAIPFSLLHQRLFK